MSLKRISVGLKSLQLSYNRLKISITGTAAQERNRNRYIRPKYRAPAWFCKQFRVKYDEMLTPENKKFLEERAANKPYSPLVTEPVLRGKWFPNCRRTGLIGIKLGIVRQWLSDGEPCAATMIQILENQVVKYIPPEEFVYPKKREKKYPLKQKLGCLVVGSVDYDPQLLTKEYRGLFTAAGIMPKKYLTRFPIHPQAAIQPGTSLYAAHFKVGDVLDISGLTVYRGFQGVMKRWGFHGMPASHGVTKTHRRPGNIGAGGEKARVWPGTKMPGEVGNKLRTLKGCKIIRIDHQYNVIYVLGRAVPGSVNSVLYLHDTLLPLRRLKEAPRFPTYYPEDYAENPLPEEEFDPMVFNLSQPTVMFEPEKETKKKK